ncbi:reverse transcriptase domain-containing protein [Tanacetum coccineum]
MRTRNSYFPNNSPVTIPRRRNRRRAPNVVKPELRTIVEVAPMADNRTMEELLQAPTEGENPHTHINNFKRITSTLKFRDVPNDVIKLMMFPYSLEGAARVWYDKEPPNLILTWDDLVNKFVNQFSPPSKTTHLKNEISQFTQKFEETFGEAWERFKEMLRACPHHRFTELTQIDTFYNGLNENDQDSLNAAAGGNHLSKTTREALNIIKNKESSSKTDERIDKLADQILTLVKIVSKKVVTHATVKAVEESCLTCGGAHAYYNCPNIDSNRSSVCAATASTSGTLPSNTIPKPKGDMKAITTRSGVAYEGPSIPTNPSPKKTLPKPNIPYPSRLNDQKFREKASNQMEKIFDISFADALLLKPRFALTIKNFLMNKEKLFELAKIPLNENCSAMLLKKLLEKLGDLGKFLIPCDFPGMDKKLSLPELTPTRMTLELADRSITRPKGLAEDVFVKVGKFHFPTDFVVVDFEADPWVPLIVGRPFLRTCHALIDVYEGELILRNGDERLIFHVDKHPQKHANESIKMINFIDVSCKDSFGEVLKLKKSNHFSSGSTTPLSDSRPSLISFETSDSLLEEFADELALLDPFPPGNEDVDFEADLREIELLLNRDPSTDFSPKITFDPNPERFTNEPALVCLPPPGDDESFFKKDVQEVNFRIYSNPLFEFDDNYNSSDINPLFNEILEDVESKDSNVSNFDEPVLLNTPLFDEDECFDPGGDINKIDAFLDDYNDSEGDVLEILHNTTHNLFPEVFFDHEPQGLKDEPDNDNLMTYGQRVRTLFLTSASTHFIFLLLSRWHLNVKWKFALPLVPSPWITKCGDRVKLCDSVTKYKALRGRHPMLIHLCFFLISNVM